MIETSLAYKDAITATRRRMLLRAVVDLISPDIVYGTIRHSAETPYSRASQLIDKELERGAPMATLEHNRWLLDGPFVPAGTLDDAEQVGLESAGLFDEDGEGDFFAEISFSGVNILQACSVYFPGNDYDGFPINFTVSVIASGVTVYEKTFTDNKAGAVHLKGFTVHYPTAIRVTAARWSLPQRRLRIAEIVPGIYEIWGNRMIESFSVVQQGCFSALSLPYGTCQLNMDNADRRFEPRSKDGLFQSIEERQGIVVSVGPEGAEYIPTGMFYQYSVGWRTGDNGLSMSWNLVDIIGLLQSRTFVTPAALPTTLEGWVAELVSQLGVNFAGRYTVDAGYASKSCSVLSADVLENKKCGQILLWLCQATLTWPRADAETGFLAVEPFWNEGNILDLDNLTAYPVMKANNDIARLDFTLSDGVQMSVPGTSAASPNTASVQNPFLHTGAAARETARMILGAYGGNQIETTGRGDPSSEIGDVVTVQLDRSTATTGRLMYQAIRFQNGTMNGCQSRLLQASGWAMYEIRVLLTESGTWTAPAGVTSLFLAVGQGGQAGYDGTDASYSENGEDGKDGSGGRIWYGTVGINSGQSFPVSIGAGGASHGAVGAHSSFGVYSSSAGSVFPNGYTDIQNGDSFGRSGVELPLPFSSDGGMGGSGGYKGSQRTQRYTYYRYYYVDASGSTREISKSEYDRLYSQGYAARLSRQSYTGTRTVTDASATTGTPGAPGGSGFVLIYYSKG